MYVQIESNICINNGFNEPFDNIDFPLTANTIITYSEYNTPITRKSLPKHIIRIYLGIKFNQPVDNLPDHIKVLSFDEDFNQPLNNLPKGLKRLHLAHCKKFNQSLDNLPTDLHILKLPVNYNGSLDKLPNRLQILHIGYDYHDTFISKLPADLTSIYVYVRLQHQKYRITVNNNGTLVNTNYWSLFHICRLNRHNRTMRQRGLFDDLL